MRLIWQTYSEQSAHEYTKILEEHGIQFQLELRPETDWGHERYGDLDCKVWIIEEEEVAVATELLERYKEDPSNPELHPKHPKKAKVPPVEPKVVLETRRPMQPQTFGPITLYILMTCILFYLMGSFSANQYQQPVPTLPLSPQLLPDVDKPLMYDYPETYQLTDELLKTFSREQLEEPVRLPPEGQQMLRKLYNTPYWKGFYPRIVANLQNGKEMWPKAPLFEEVRKGQVWRLITPIFLHGGLLHILFNMMWLLVLGRQIEMRLSRLYFALLILISALVSNTAQYLMSGPDFIGFSGVICAMLAFIWIRQKKAPHEMYDIHPSTFRFIFIFVFGLFALQFFFFIREVTTQSPVSFGIANTAHIVGALTGLLFGAIKK